MWEGGEPAKMEVSWCNCNVSQRAWGLKREEFVQELLWRTSKFPGCPSENRELEAECWLRMVTETKIILTMFYCCSSLAVSFLTQWEVIIHWKLGFSFSPPRTPGTLQLISSLLIRGHLTFWICVLDTWASLLIHSFSVPTELEQPQPGGHVRHCFHTWIRFTGESGPEPGELHPAVWLRAGGNWKYQDSVD